MKRLLRYHYTAFKIGIGEVLFRRFSKKYKDHYKSKYWQKVRDSRFGNGPVYCKLCVKRRAFQLHHETYKHFGKELDHPEDLVEVCQICHLNVEFKKRIVSLFVDIVKGLQMIIVAIAMIIWYILVGIVTVIGYIVEYGIAQIKENKYNNKYNGRRF